MQRFAYLSFTLFLSVGVVACSDGSVVASDPDPNPGVELVGYTVVGHGEELERFTSDLWVHGNVAYTGTWGSRASSGSPKLGNRLYAWDVSDPANPVRAGSVTVDARTVNDVKIRSDGTLGVITHEGSNDGMNGITLIDLTNPLQPSAITRFTESLEVGVHNAWIEGDYVYLVVDGVSPASGLRILDISDPANPAVVAAFYGGSSFLHDVYVRDGLAFLSHWDAGLIILDVGNGISGGSPDNPVEVGRVVTAGGDVHNAWYWPARGLVFVGEEDFGSPGIMHVVDAGDLTNPVEIGSFAVPFVTPHNFWLDEATSTLYMGWYEQGIRTLEVSGSMNGAFSTDDEVGFARYGGTGFGCAGSSAETSTCSWAPQLVGNLVYVADMNSGLWVLRPDF